MSLKGTFMYNIHTQHRHSQNNDLWTHTSELVTLTVMVYMQKIPHQRTNVVVSPFPTSMFQHEHTDWWQESVDVECFGWQWSWACGHRQSEQQTNNCTYNTHLPYYQQHTATSTAAAATTTTIKCLSVTDNKYAQPNSEIWLQLCHESWKIMQMIKQRYLSVRQHYKC